MKQLLILITASFIACGCSKSTSKQAEESSSPSLQVNADNIDSFTIIYFDSGDNTSPSENDSKWIVTNRSDIAVINEIIQTSLSSLQNEPFGESMSWPILMIGAKLKGGEIGFAIGVEILREGHPIYCDTWSSNSKYFIIQRQSGFLEKLGEIGLPIDEFDISKKKTNGLIPKTHNEIKSNQ